MSRNQFRKMVTSMVGSALFILGIITMCYSESTILAGALVMIVGVITVIIASRIGKNNEIHMDLRKVQNVVLVVGIGIVLNAIGITVMSGGNWIVGLAILFAGWITLACLIPVVKGIRE